MCAQLSTYRCRRIVSISDVYSAPPFRAARLISVGSRRCRIRAFEPATPRGPNLSLLRSSRVLASFVDMSPTHPDPLAPAPIDPSAAAAISQRPPGLPGGAGAGGGGGVDVGMLLQKVALAGMSNMVRPAHTRSISSTLLLSCSSERGRRQSPLLG